MPFQKGNKLQQLKLNNNPDVRNLREIGKKQLFLLIDRFLNLTDEDLERILNDKKRLTKKQEIVINFLNMAAKYGDVQRFTKILNLYGLVTDLKAIAIKDLDESDKILEEGFKLPLSQQEKNLMKLKVLEILDSETESQDL